MFAIFEKLGGSERAIEALRADPLREGWPSKHAIKVWRKNRRLPPKVATQLMRICEERGIEYTLADFSAEDESAE